MNVYKSFIESVSGCAFLSNIFSPLLDFFITLFMSGENEVLIQALTRIQSRTDTLTKKNESVLF